MKKHKIISVDSEKQNETSFMIKTVNKLALEKDFFNPTKRIKEKPTANITLRGERLKVFALTSGTRQGCLLSLILFNIILQALVRAVRQEKQIKGIQFGKEEVKLYLQIT